MHQQLQQLTDAAKNHTAEHDAGADVDAVGWRGRRILSSGRSG